MTLISSPRPRKKASLGAAVIFGLFYLATLALVFAPEGSFGGRDIALWQTDN